MGARECSRAPGGSSISQSPLRATEVLTLQRKLSLLSSAGLQWQVAVAGIRSARRLRVLASNAGLERRTLTTDADSELGFRMVDTRRDPQTRPPDGTARCDRQTRPPDATGRYDRQIRPADTTGRCDRQMRPPDATGRRDRQMRPADATGRRDRQMRPADATGRCARQMRPADATG